MASLYAYGVSGLGDIPVELAEFSYDELSLESFPRKLQRFAEGCRRIGALRTAYVRRHVVSVYFAGRRHDDKTFNEIPEFAHVSRPIVTRKKRERFATDSVRAPAGLKRKLVQKMPDKDGYVAFPFPEGRHAKRNYVK